VRSAVKILFVTDDRESYALGNYYLAYQRAFLRHGDVALAHPLEPLPNPDRFDLIVLGHSAIENYARMRGKRFVPGPLRHRLWFRHAGLRALRRSKTPAVVFTKNDYKHFEIKNAFIDFVRPRLVITHTRSALAHLINPHGRIAWLPFGVDTEQFAPPATNGSRRFELGFRANANSEWNAGERERFFRALGRLDNVRRVSLTLSQNGEGFLVGKPYVEWMQSCAVLGNTVSAAGTVGPRFLEAMACGTIPLAPRHTYEGFLVADEHYIPVDGGSDGTFPGLEAALARYFEDRGYRERLLDGARRLVATENVDQHVLKVCARD
jgi:glycosyltransferase involved in cell wall biosynthesis